MGCPKENGHDHEHDNNCTHWDAQLCAECGEADCPKHHAHGHSDSCGCASCHIVENIFSENEADEKAENSEFRHEITYLAVCGAIFAAALVLEEFMPDIAPKWAFSAVFLLLYAATGWTVLIEMFRALSKWDIFNEFTLMGGATLAALAIGEMSEAVGVMLFYRLGEAFQERASSNSRRSIKALLAQKPMSAHLVIDDRIVEKEPGEIVRGDIVQVLPGEIIPIDGEIISGASQINTSAITGESVPVSAGVGNEVHGGTLSIDGVLLIRAAGPFEDSTISRMLEMVQEAVEHKSPTERFITRFSKWYTPAVFFLAAAVIMLPPLTGHGSWHEWIYRGLVLLVISCPCALVISIPLGYFGGIGAASKHGILVKGANVFDAVGNVEFAVFDKTGTLTYGQFSVAKILPAEGISDKELLDAAAKAEYGSSHPVAKAIAAAAGEEPVPEGAEITQVPGKGMVYKEGGETILAGNDALLKEYGVSAPAVDTGGTIVRVVKDGRYIGSITVEDSIRKDAASAVKELRALGIKDVYMLTGDRKETAENVAKAAGLDGFKAELLPGDKVEALKELCKGDTKKTLYVGDGVNDGPVLVTSETGIAMGGFGSQVAVEVADAVILDDSPSKVAELLRIAKKTRAIVWENVVMALGVKGIFLIMGIAGVAGLWEAVFADVGVALLAILNSARATRLQ